MKKVLTLFLLTAISLTSCSSDDNKGETEHSNISFSNVNFNDKAPGETVILEGKGLDPEQESKYKIIFRKQTTAPKLSTRALPPDNSFETVDAVIYRVTTTSVEFNIPKEATNGEVIFRDGKFDLRLTNYNYKK
ncbi:MULTISPECIES: hypothetical protein [Myroides]|uniref:Lipoprotein n=1 Tax=Myroides albus TaxID=2562892 RepID=A0A6I3LPM5_9FLAO|nr:MULTISPECIES: hypothetical protein [Myroides]MTG98611.1 hypothetical protein [Myroides albus]MVX35881.1 hypothetical protein [Myroides sp. LoEW2-1]UVD79981.1 hypothetical protein NWE55_01430 [Myroides albus]